MKIIIFGLGKVYRQNKENISAKDEIVAFIDNNEKIQGKTIDKIEVYNPTQISQIVYDKIVIMSVHFDEMRNQLLRIGCQNKDILHYPEYISKNQIGSVCSKSCLIITSEVGYHGGALVAVYTALALQNKGYKIVIVTPKGDCRFIKEFKHRGITFILYPNINSSKWDELFWVENFGVIIANTFPMIMCALRIIKCQKVLAWLHESDIVYNTYADIFEDEIVKNISNPNLKIYAVSNVARENFINNFGYCKVGLLPCAIPDLNKGIKKLDNKLTFAVIATIHPIKQQLVYLDAIKRLDDIYQKSNEFLIIGRTEDDDYAYKIKEEAKSIQNLKLMGELARTELESIYSQIDVLIISSSQETMSLVAIEAMMYGKVCIVCDVAGIADFICDGVNGLLYKTNDISNLAEKITYCIKNKDYLIKLCENARRTYCQYFTMEILADRITEIFSSSEGDMIGE